MIKGASGGKSPRSTSQRIYPSRRKDPYVTDSKLKGNPECSSCGVIFMKGHWIEIDLKKRKKLFIKPTGQAICPSCRKKKDRYACGVVELTGPGLIENFDEIQKTVVNTEKIARSKNSQQRVLWTQRTGWHQKAVYKIFVSQPEIAKRISRVLVRTFKGSAEENKDDLFIRIAVALG